MAKKINADKIWSLIKKRKQQTFARLKKRYQKLSAELEKLQKEKSKLEKAGIEFGTPSWKTQVTRGDGGRKKYLRILYASGKRKYIGCKEDKIQQTLQAIKRGERVRLLQLKIRNLELEIEKVINDIKGI